MAAGGAGSELFAAADSMEDAFVRNPGPVELDVGGAVQVHVGVGGAFVDGRWSDQNPGARALDLQLDVSLREDGLSFFPILGPEVGRTALMERNGTRVAGPAARAAAPLAALRPRRLGRG